MKIEGWKGYGFFWPFSWTGRWSGTLTLSNRIQTATNSELQFKSSYLVLFLNVDSFSSGKKVNNSVAENLHGSKFLSKLYTATPTENRPQYHLHKLCIIRRKQKESVVSFIGFTIVKATAFHKYGPGSILTPTLKSGLSSLVFFPAQRNFSPLPKNRNYSASVLR